MIGTTVSHYKIFEKLGGGGMGVVYKAHDTHLDRSVALKFLPPDLTRDSDARERFIHEAKATSALQHNNICNIHDIEETKDGQLFIVMDCYEGETLKKRIERGALAIEEVMNIALQVAQGLQKAHEKGIVHRDIKPANLLITNDGVVKILDFGLAKLTGDTSLTKTGSRLGTAGYMSPEQVQANAVDARSDLFSLGVVMYEMATGTRPFVGEHDAVVMYAIVSLNPAPLTSIIQMIPKELEAIVFRLLEKDAANRTQTAAELCFDLDRLLGQTVPTHKLSVRPRMRVLKRIYTVIGAVVVLALLAWFVSTKLFPPPAKHSAWRIGILQFRLLAQQPECGDWPMQIQMMMVDQLNGVEELRIIDPFSLNNVVNAGAAGNLQAFISGNQPSGSFVLNGTIESIDTSFVIRCTLTDLADGSVKLTRTEPYRSEHELPQAVQNISAQVLNYFEIQVLSRGQEESLRPWLNHRTKQLDAITAFLQGSLYVRRMQPGGAKFFRKAIELDSTFITPRAWLISGLVNKGELTEAKEHQAFLVRHLLTAGPFEQAFVRWTGALITGDVLAQGEALEDALEYSPHNNVLLYLLADLKYSQGEYEAAERAIRPAVESGWAFQPASLLLGQSLFQMQKLSESREVLEQSLDFEIVLPESYGLLAALALHDGDAKVAEDYIREFSDRARGKGWPTDSIYAFVAEDLAFLGMYKSASEYYRKAIDLNAKKADYYLGLAKSALELGDASTGEQAARHAFVLDSASLRAQGLLGRASEMQKDTAAALRRYRTFLSKDSTSLQSAEIRRRVRGLMRN